MHLSFWITSWKYICNHKTFIKKVRIKQMLYHRKRQFAYMWRDIVTIIFFVCSFHTCQFISCAIGRNKWNFVANRKGDIIMTNLKRDLVTQKRGNDIPLEPQWLDAYDSPKLNDHLESIRLETVTFSRTGPSLDPTAEVRAHTHRNHSTSSANKLENCEIRDMRLTGCSQC